MSWACSSSGTRRMMYTRLSTINVVRSAAFAPPAAILSSTMSIIAQCRHSSASCSDRLGTSSLGITVPFANSLRAWHHTPLSQLDLPWRARKVQRMSYVREVLQPGEEIRFRTNVYWFVYLPAMVMFVLGIAFALWYTAAASQHLMLLILSGLSAVTGVLLFIPAWLKRFGTEIAVTDRRVIYKTGLVQRDTTEINRAKIESVDVSQSILGRVFDFGTLTIRGTGETIEALRNIASPLQFRNAIMVC